MPSLRTSSSYGSSDEPLAAIGPDVLLQGPPGTDDQGEELAHPGPDWNRPWLAEKERVGERDRPGEADPGRGRPDGQERHERQHVPGEDGRARHDDATDQDDPAGDQGRATCDERREDDPGAERQQRERRGVDQRADESRVEELRRDVLRKRAERAEAEMSEGRVSRADDEPERRQRRDPRALQQEKQERGRIELEERAQDEDCGGGTSTTADGAP